MNYVTHSLQKIKELLLMPKMRKTLLYDVDDYKPDTFDLNTNHAAAEYWFPCFRELIAKFAKQAAESQRNVVNTTTTTTSTTETMQQDDVQERAEKFRQTYLEQLALYESKTAENAEKNIVLGIRELLELNDIYLRRYGFPDPWQRQKQLENEAAIALLERRVEEIDAIENSNARWIELVRGVLAGNMFDWGAQAVTAIMEKEKNFGLHTALERIEKRPWLIDNLDGWLQRLNAGQPHKCAAIFVDNSGVDVVLGILPFARELLRRGTKVLLCANTEPSLNDVTASELTDLLINISNKKKFNILTDALSNKQLLIYQNGMKGPCLDMRKLPQDLNEAINENETDLLVIEGMGRALHTNLYAKFNCETLKLAVIKNKWLAQYLGGDTFSVICKYETIS